MLSKKNRIHKEFFTQQKKGRVFHSPFFTLRVIPTEKKHPPFSFVVSRKASAKSVTRNRLKRQGYAVIKDILSKLEKNKHTSAHIFYFKKEATGLSFSELKKEILDVLKKAVFISDR